jgi:ankyrin repeat protein
MAIIRSYENIIRKSKTAYDWLKRLHSIKSLDSLDSEGRSALEVSAYYGHLTACQYIIDKGGNINNQNRDGKTPLMSVFESYGIHGDVHGLSNVIAYFLQSGADVDLRDTFSATALLYACKHERSAIFAFEIISSGADVNALDHFHSSSLMHCCAARNIELCEALIKKGALLNITDLLGRNALMYLLESSFKTGYGNTVEDENRKKAYKLIDILVREKITLDSSNSETGNNLLTLSAEHNFEKLLTLCIAAGVPINHRNILGDSALIVSAKHANSAIAKILLSAGANLWAINNEKKDAYWYALDIKQRFGKKEYLDTLDHFANTIAKRKTNSDEGSHAVYSTPDLGEVIRKGSIEVVRSLLEKGANVEEADKFGKTPLMIACKSGSAEKLQEILNHKPNVNQQDRYGKTALHYLMDDKYYGDDDKKKFIMLMGVTDLDPNLQTKAGMTALMFACRQTLVDHFFIKALLEKGADQRIKTQKGQDIYSFIKRYNTPLLNLLRQHAT